jgi:TPR repeat protein
MRKSLNWEHALRILARVAVLLAAFAYGSSEGQERPSIQAAARYYEAACGTGTAMGNALACYRLAELYWEGRGVTQDRIRAGLLYQKACERKDLEPRACLRLGELYEKGEVAPKAPQRALTLYRMACDAGAQEACARLTQSQASSGVQPLQATPPAAPAQPPRSAPSAAPAPPSQATLPAASAQPPMTRKAQAPAQKQKMSLEELNRRLLNLDTLSPDEVSETLREFSALVEEAERLERELKGGN